MDGAVYPAKHVILALSSVLAKNFSFTPALPPYREKLMQKVFLGSMIKTVVLYKEAFWKDQGLSGEVVHVVN